MGCGASKPLHDPAVCQGQRISVVQIVATTESSQRPSLSAQDPRPTPPDNESSAPLQEFGSTSEIQPPPNSPASPLPVGSSMSVHVGSLHFTAPPRGPAPPPTAPSSPAEHREMFPIFIGASTLCKDHSFSVAVGPPPNSPVSMASQEPLTDPAEGLSPAEPLEVNTKNMCSYSDTVVAVDRVSKQSSWENDATGGVTVVRFPKHNAAHHLIESPLRSDRTLASESASEYAATAASPRDREPLSPSCVPHNAHVPHTVPVPQHGNGEDSSDTVSMRSVVTEGSSSSASCCPVRRDPPRTRSKTPLPLEKVDRDAVSPSFESSISATDEMMFVCANDCFA